MKKFFDASFRFSLLLAILSLTPATAWGGTASFDASNCGTNSNDGSGKPYSVTTSDGVKFTTTSLKWYKANNSNKYFYLDSKVNAEVSWAVPDGYNISFSNITVNAAAKNGTFGATKGWNISTNVSGNEQVSKSGNSFQDATLTSSTFLLGLGNDGKLSLTHGDTEMQIKTISFTYELVAVNAPNITIQSHAEITNNWHSTLNLNGYILMKNNPQNITISESSDAEVATWNGTQFVLGHKSGTASFQISADNVTAKTFTITTHQPFYEYAHAIVGEAALQQTHNQAEAETVIASYRAEQMAALSGNDVDINYMLENRDFQFSSDWDYGWTGTNDDTHTGNPGGWGAEGDPMTGYQKKDDNGNIYPWMYRGNDALYNFTLAAGNFYQNVTLPAGYYRLTADVKCNANNSNINLAATLYAKDGSTTIGRYDKKCVQSSGFSNVAIRFAVDAAKSITIGQEHNELKNTSMKEVAADNFSLTYLCSYAEYQAYLSAQAALVDYLSIGARYNYISSDLQSNIATAYATNIETLTGAEIVAKTAAMKGYKSTADDVYNTFMDAIVTDLDISDCYLYLSENNYINTNNTYGVLDTDALPLSIVTHDAKATFVKAGDAFLYDAGAYELKFGNTQGLGYYFVGDEENGYKIYIPNNVWYALGVDGTRLKLVEASSAPRWKIGRMVQPSAPGLAENNSTLYIGGENFSIFATPSVAGAQLTYSVDANATIQGNVVTPTSEGTAVVTILQSATGIYHSTSATITLTIRAIDAEDEGLHEQKTTTVTVTDEQDQVVGYYASFCAQYNFRLQGAKAYKGHFNDETGNIQLTSMGDDVIVPAGEGIIIVSQTQNYTIIPTAEDATADTDGNILVGTIQRTPLASYRENGDFTYALNTSTNKFGKYTGEYMPAGKAFLVGNYGSTQATPLRIVVGNSHPVATDIHTNSLSTDAHKVLINGQIYIVRKNSMFYLK